MVEHVNTCYRCTLSGSRATPQVQYAAYPNTNNACKRGEQMGVQVVASLAIVLWTVTTAGLVFVLTNCSIGMRVDAFLEEDGLDRSIRNSNFAETEKSPAPSQQQLAASSQHHPGGSLST
jgi:ammonia channel protein AmtB